MGLARGRSSRGLTGEELVREAGGSDASGGAGDDGEGGRVVQVVGHKDAPLARSLLHACQGGGRGRRKEEEMSVCGFSRRKNVIKATCMPARRT